MLKLYVRLFFLLVGILSLIVLWQRTQLAAFALTRTDPLPTTYEFMADERYADAGNYLAFFMEFEYVNQNPEAQALNEDISNIRSSWSYQGVKLAEGILYGKSDELIGQTAGVASDFFVVGDLRDLAFQGINLANREEVDELLIALAGLGLATSAAQVISGAGTVVTAGAAAPSLIVTSATKSGLIALKIARKMGKLPSWLTKTIIKSNKSVKSTDEFRALVKVLNDVNILARTRGGFQLLRETKSASELHQMTKFSSHLKEHSLTIYRIGGKTAVKLAQQADRISGDTIKLAATFGKGGIKILSYIGPERFKTAVLKIRKIKTLYKGEIYHLIAMLLMLLPTWTLMICVIACVVVCVPKRLLLSVAQKLFKNSSSVTNSDAH